MYRQNVNSNFRLLHTRKDFQAAEAELYITRCLHMTLIQQLEPVSMINWIYCLLTIYWTNKPVIKPVTTGQQVLWLVVNTKYSA